LSAGARPAARRGGAGRSPPVTDEWAARVQQAGLDLYGNDFRFAAHELGHFAASDPASRERLPGGDVRFATIPRLGERFVVFSGSVAKELLRYRLDPDHAGPPLASPFAHLRFEHPGTRWYNVASLEGSARYFPGNALRIIDFFARKVVENIHGGRRTLLVTRKKFVRLCRRLLLERLAALGE